MSDRIAPSERPPWMTDQDWAEFIEWDRAVAAHYGVVIEPEYVGVSDSAAPAGRSTLRERSGRFVMKHGSAA